MNPRDFEDLGSFAKHDHYAVDLRIDKVDEALQKLVNNLLGIVWTNVHVENEMKAKSLERFSQVWLAGAEKMMRRTISRRF